MLNIKNPELSGFSSEEMKEVYEFHKSLPDYQATPLVDLKTLASYYGVKKYG